MQSTSCEMLGWMTQAGVRIAERNINNLRYVDDTEREEQLKSFFVRVKEKSEKAGLKLSIQETKVASGPLTSWQIDGGNWKQ